MPTNTVLTKEEISVFIVNDDPFKKDSTLKEDIELLKKGLEGNKMFSEIDETC
jgi:hypothetical protein